MPLRGQVGRGPGCPWRGVTRVLSVPCCDCSIIFLYSNLSLYECHFDFQCVCFLKLCVVSRFGFFSYNQYSVAGLNLTNDYSGHQDSTRQGGRLREVHPTAPLHVKLCLH